MMQKLHQITLSLNFPSGNYTWMDSQTLQVQMQVKFKVSNNQTENEALIAGLRRAKELKVDSINIYNDSQLVVY